MFYCAYCMSCLYRRTRGWLPLGCNIPYDLAVYVCQTKVAAGVAVGQPLVVEAQQMQNRRVQVVDTGGLVHGLEPEIVGVA